MAPRAYLEAQTLQNPDSAQPSALPAVWHGSLPDARQHEELADQAAYPPAPQAYYSVNPGQILPHAQAHDLPWHMSTLLDHELPRPKPEWVKALNEYHVPGIAGTIVFTAFGWMAHTEPMHPWIAGLFIGAGVAGLVGAWCAHHKHGQDADAHFTKGLAGLGVAAISGGAAIGAGPTGISYMVAFAMAVGAVVGVHQYREHKRHVKAVTAVEFHAAVNQGKVHVVGPGPSTAASPNVVDGRALSQEEALLHRAFADMGIEPITLRGFERLDKDAFNVIVGLPGTSTNDPETVIGKREVLKSNLRARQIAVEASSEHGHELKLMVRYGATNPLLETIPWKGPNTDDVAQPIRTSVDLHGDDVLVRFANRHTLYAGKTRRGKSAGIASAICSIGATRNAQLWLMDLKPGQVSLGPFAAMAAQSVEGRDQQECVERASLMILAAVAAMEENGQILKDEREATGKPVYEWDVNKHGPAIALVIDELAYLLRLDPAIYEGWVTIMQVGAGLGVWVIGATQSPSAKALGGTTDGSSQFGNVFCYQCKGATQAGIILGQGSWSEGWKPNERNLPLQGMHLLRTPEHIHPVVMRNEYVEPGDAMDIADRYADSVPDLHPRTAAAVERVLSAGLPAGKGPRGGGKSDRPIDGEIVYPRPYLVPEYPDGEPIETHHRAVWEAFKEMGSATIDELKALRLEGHRSRESCKTALNVFVKHDVAYSEMDGRTERFHCLVASPNRKEAS